MASKKYAVAYRQDGGRPWIGLPGVTTSGGDLQTMFKNAGLADWNMEKRLIDTGAWTDSPDFEIVRNNPAEGGRLERLHVSKERYELYPNENVLAFVNNVAFGNLEADAMGTLSGGRKVFMSFKVGDDVEVKGTDDKIATYLHVRTSHDGSWAFGTYSGQYRLMCQNQLTSVKANALSSFTIRHTKTMEGRVEDARQALGLSIKQNDLFLTDMGVLAQSKMTDSQFWALVKDIYPEPQKDVKGSKAKWTNKTDTIMGLWNGPTVANLDKTAYRAYNALNEELMWYATVRAGNVENALARTTGFDATTQKHNVDLYRKVLAAA